MVEMCVEAVTISIGLARSRIFRSICFLVKSKTTYRIITETVLTWPQRQRRDQTDPTARHTTLTLLLHFSLSARIRLWNAAHAFVSSIAAERYENEMA